MGRTPPSAAWNTSQIFHLRLALDLLTAAILRRTPGEWLSCKQALSLLPSDISVKDQEDAITLFRSYSPLRLRRSDARFTWYISKARE